MKTLKERVDIEIAYLDGAVLQYNKRNRGDWRDLFDSVEVMVFDWSDFDYRIKPEPMEFWVNVYPNGNILSAHETEATSKENVKLVAGVKSIKVREITDE